MKLYPLFNMMVLYTSVKVFTCGCACTHVCIYKAIRMCIRENLCQNSQVISSKSTCKLSRYHTNTDSSQFQDLGH